MVGALVTLAGALIRCKGNEATRAAATADNRYSRHLDPKEGFPRMSLFEPSNEANNERGECGENVGSSSCSRSHHRAACCFSSCQIEWASRSLTCRMPRLLNSRRQARHSRQVAILARHRICSVCQRAGKPLRVKVAVDAGLTL
jgi:hypothetical protein